MFVFRVGVLFLGVGFQIVNHRVAHGIGEGGLLPHENVIRKVVPLKGVPQQVFALAVVVALHFGVQSHDVFHKIQIAEGHPGFQRVDADAAVCPEHIVHMQLPDPLFRFLLEFLRAGGKVRIFVAEKLIGNLSREQHPQVCVLVDVFAYQIHADGGPDGGDIVGAQQRHHMGQGFQHVVLRDNDLRMVGAQIVRHLTGIFQVDGVDVHADGEGPDGLFADPGGHGTDQTGIQTAGEQEAHGGVGIQPLFNAGGELFPNAAAGGFQIVRAAIGRGAHIPVADEFAVLIVMSRGKGHDLCAQAYQIFGLAGENNLAVFIVAVVQRPDADRIPGSHKGFAVKENHGELRVQIPEHFGALLLIKGQQDLAVRVTVEDMALLLQTFPDSPEAVNFAVADHGGVFPDKGLHTHFGQPHNSQPVKAQEAPGDGDDPAHIRPTGDGAVKIRLHRLRRQTVSDVTNDGTHGNSFFLCFVCQNRILQSGFELSPTLEKDMLDKIDN